MSVGDTSHGEPWAVSDQPLVYQVRLRISGIRCVSEGAPLERALRRFEGVRDATVNALIEGVWLQVDKLWRIEGILRLLVKRGYSVDMHDVSVTIWIRGSPIGLEGLRHELSSFPHVTYCRLERPAGRLELGLALVGAWERSLREICATLRLAVR